MPCGSIVCGHRTPYSSILESWNASRMLCWSAFWGLGMPYRSILGVLECLTGQFLGPGRPYKSNSRSRNALHVNFWVPEYCTGQFCGYHNALRVGTRMPCKSTFGSWNALQVKFFLGPGMPYRSVFWVPECPVGQFFLGVTDCLACHFWVPEEHLVSFQRSEMPFR